MARRTQRSPTAGANHLEWLRLVEVSGPFLSLPVLKEALPQGLEADDRDVRAELKAAHAEWNEHSHDRAYHTQWIRFVLARALEYGPEVLVDGPAIPAKLRVRAALHNETLQPDYAVLGLAAEGERPARLVIQVLEPGTDLERALEGARWKASPLTRMVELLRGSSDSDLSLGLVTNGEKWVLVSAPRKGTTTFVTWHASLWFEEKITLQAFRTLLGVRRTLGAAADTLERLIERSAEHQHDVTIQLGLQVREAIELLVRRIDELDRRSNRTVLVGVSEKQVYEAAVTVMMRLVFVFYLEEQAELYFPVAKSTFYQRHYALSPLGATLRAEADRLGPDVLERRSSAWCRLLACFRAIHGGVVHEDMRLPAYGGHLFDPDRFPFLEGRKPGESWRNVQSSPLGVDDATVLFVLEALQVLRVRDTGANGAETRRLSFRELGVEQIGNVYESLLDHTAKRATDAVVSLKGPKGEEPEIELRALEQCYDAGDPSKLVSFVMEKTGRSEPSITKDLEYEIEDDSARWLVACGNDRALYGRVKPVAGLVREDRRQQPAVYPKDSVYVTAGADRRSTGTHYTPPSLTEPVVRYALEPLVYVGPAEGLPETEWKLRAPREILALRVCDLACGSGAFLVQACRYLAERLVEAWELLEGASPGRLLVTPEGGLSTGAQGERIIPKDDVERQAIARRVVADRCLYGVDINPMAVEMAKLSLWLTTLQRDKPFGFLDHSIRWGDALLGVTDAWQLERLTLTDPNAHLVLGSESLRGAIRRASTLRRQLESITTETVSDVERKAALLREAEAELLSLHAIADALVAAYLDAYQQPAGRRARKLKTNLEQDLSSEALGVLEPTQNSDERIRAARKCSQRAAQMLRAETPSGDSARHPLHWLLELPELFDGGDTRGRLSCFIGNPPFLGTIKSATALPPHYVELVREVGLLTLGGADNGMLLFLSRLLKLVGAEHRYGLIFPVAALSGSPPWQSEVATSSRPDYMALYPLGTFGSAAVRTVAVVGGSVRNAEIQTVNHERDETWRGQWPVSATNWYELLAGAASAAPSKKCVKLHEMFDLHAGCATGAAYELLPHVVDRVVGSGLRLINTGLIDRFTCHWGKRTVRYLGSDFESPRWPSGDDAPQSVIRARERQAGRPKILLGGLTTTLEAYLDQVGDCAGVVSTWIIPENVAHRPWHLARTLMALNSATATIAYRRREAGNAMGGKQVTIKKDALQTIPLPAALFSSPFTAPDLRTLTWADLCRERWAELEDSQAVRALDALQAVLCEDKFRSSEVWAAADNAAHLLVSFLYGESEDEALATLRDWAVLAQRKRVPLSFHESVKELCAAWTTGSERDQ